MTSRTIKIATRQSPLALWQANYVKEALISRYPALTVELLPMVTDGDIILDSPLSKIGGKGLFVKQLEKALLQGDADLAVHSIKDIPAEFPDGLMLSTYCERDDIRDALVSNHYSSLDQLPEQAVVGTSSLRRQAQLKAHYPHLQIKDLRGNVGTRLSKLDHGEYDAILLASAGLKRLGLHDRIAASLPVTTLLPAVGQGAIGIEIRESDLELQALLAPLDHSLTRTAVIAERAMNRVLNGGCQVPIAAYSQYQDDRLILTGWVGSLDGQTQITVTLSAPIEEGDAFAEALGLQVGEALLAQGADAILSELLR